MSPCKSRERVGVHDVVICRPRKPWPRRNGCNEMPARVRVEARSCNGREIKKLQGARSLQCQHDVEQSPRIPVLRRGRHRDAKHATAVRPRNPQKRARHAKRHQHLHVPPVVEVHAKHVRCVRRKDERGDSKHEHASVWPTQVEHAHNRESGGVHDDSTGGEVVASFCEHGIPRVEDGTPDPRVQAQRGVYVPCLRVRVRRRVHVRVSSPEEERRGWHGVGDGKDDAERFLAPERASEWPLSVVLPHSFHLLFSVKFARLLEVVHAKVSAVGFARPPRQQ
mmetsp:Transcript_1246/g.2778  ORF Transcript_1246/g.2778 Transcript_1246/m.2778 type:complete len:280 (-) Transcript_1246:162-1001(-)